MSLAQPHLSSSPKSGFYLFETEVLPSLILRMARYFGVNIDVFVKLVTGRKQDILACLSDEKIAAQIAAISRLPLHQIKAAQLSHSSVTGDIIFNEKRLPRKYVEIGRRRVAPGIFAEDISQNVPPFHRRDWLLSHVISDPISNERILEVCPACNKPMTWLSSVYVERCDNCAEKLWFTKPEFLQGIEFDYDQGLSELKVLRSFNDDLDPTEYCKDHALDGIDRLDMMDALVWLEVSLNPASKSQGLLWLRTNALQKMHGGPDQIVSRMRHLADLQVQPNRRLSETIAKSKLITAIASISNQRVNRLFQKLVCGA